MSASVSLYDADAWDVVECKRAERVELQEVIRARRVLFAATREGIERRRKLAAELGDLLASVLLEIDNLNDAAEVIGIALGLAEDRCLRS